MTKKKQNWIEWWSTRDSFIKFILCFLLGLIILTIYFGMGSTPNCKNNPDSRQCSCITYNTDIGNCTKISSDKYDLSYICQSKTIIEGTNLAGIKTVNVYKTCIEAVDK